MMTNSSNHLLLRNSEIVIHSKGLLKPVYIFYINNRAIAELFWEKEVFAEQAFYTTATTRFEIGARGILKRSIEVMSSGIRLLEIDVKRNWNKGSIVSSEGHCYSFQTSGLLRRKTKVIRDVGLQSFFTILGNDFRGRRKVIVEPAEVSEYEFHALLAGVVFHVITTEKAAAAAC